MNGADVLILVVLVLGALQGLRQGFVIQLATIFGALIALGIARVEYHPVRQVLHGLAPHSPWLTVVSYLIVFLVVWAVIIVVARVLRRLMRLFLLGWMDRLGGMVVGILQGALLIELLLYLGKHLPNHELRHLTAHATLAPLFLDAVPYINKLFPSLPHY